MTSDVKCRPRAIPHQAPKLQHLHQRRAFGARGRRLSEGHDPGMDGQGLMNLLSRHVQQHDAILPGWQAEHLQRSLDSLGTELPATRMAQLQAAASPASTSLLHTALGSARYAQERLFDMNGDGLRERSAWVGGTSALLALDLKQYGHSREAANDRHWRDAA